MQFDGLFYILLGVFFTLAGFGVISVNKTPEQSKLWLAKYGRLMSFIGPAMILGGLVQFFGLLR